MANSPMRPMLGIESSCDETATAVLDPAGRVLAEAVHSQETDHAPFGGVVPEIAARAHLAVLPGQIAQVMARSGLNFADLGGVAASAGPGLIGGLIVGSQVAKGIAIAHRIPYIAVNHLEGHALTARLPGLVPNGASFPYLLLLVSGGPASASRLTALGATSASAARSTTRPGRPLTRWRNCWASAGPAGRCWSGWRRPATPHGTISRAR